MSKNIPKCSECKYHTYVKSSSGLIGFRYCTNRRTEDRYLRARLLKSKSRTSDELGYKTSPFWCPRLDKV